MIYSSKKMVAVSSVGLAGLMATQGVTVGQAMDFKQAGQEPELRKLRKNSDGSSYRSTIPSNVGTGSDGENNLSKAEQKRLRKQRQRQSRLDRIQDENGVLKKDFVANLLSKVQAMNAKTLEERENNKTQKLSVEKFVAYTQTVLPAKQEGRTFTFECRGKRSKDRATLEVRFATKLVQTMFHTVGLSSEEPIAKYGNVFPESGKSILMKLKYEKPEDRDADPPLEYEVQGETELKAVSATKEPNHHNMRKFRGKSSFKIQLEDQNAKKGDSHQYKMSKFYQPKRVSAVEQVVARWIVESKKFENQNVRIQMPGGNKNRFCAWSRQTIVTGIEKNRKHFSANAVIPKRK